MKQVKLLLILLITICITQISAAQTNSNEYLEGAVPEVNGKVVFAQTMHLPKISKQEIFHQLELWMEKRFNTKYSRVVYKDSNQGQLVAQGNDTLIFKSTFLALDQAIINYQIVAEVRDAECQLIIDRINYSYENNKRYNAEELITDKIALNKAKTKLYKGFSKWRIHTVDFMNDLLLDATQHLYKLNEQGLTKQQTTSNSTAPIQQQNKKQSEDIISTQTTIQLPPQVLSIISMEDALIKYQEGEPLICSPDESILVGTLWGKPVLSILTPYGSDLYYALEANYSYKISFYPKGLNEGELKEVYDKEASLTIDCYTAISQSITPESIISRELREKLGNRVLSKLYISEIRAIQIK